MLTQKRKAEIARLPIFNGVVYGNVTQAELDEYMAERVPPERVGEIMDEIARREKKP